MTQIVAMLYFQIGLNFNISIFTAVTHFAKNQLHKCAKVFQKNVCDLNLHKLKGEND